MDVRRVSIVRVNDHVVRKNTNDPIGIVESLTGVATATVRWGVIDRREYKEDIPVEELDVIVSNIFSPDEVVRRSVEKAGGHFLEE